VCVCMRGCVGVCVWVCVGVCVCVCVCVCVKRKRDLMSTRLLTDAVKRPNHLARRKGQRLTTEDMLVVGLRRHGHGDGHTQHRAGIRAGCVVRNDLRVVDALGQPRTVDLGKVNSWPWQVVIRGKPEEREEGSV
jgi:hypothetical protein